MVETAVHAAIDIGTNSIHLVVARLREGGGLIMSEPCNDNPIIRLARALSMDETPARFPLAVVEALAIGYALDSM